MPMRQGFARCRYVGAVLAARFPGLLSVSVGKGATAPAGTSNAVAIREMQSLMLLVSE